MLGRNACEINSMIRELGGDAFQDTCIISTTAKCSMPGILFWFLASLTSMQLDIERQRARVVPLTAGYHTMQPLVQYSLK